ncbi:hypothetical protein B0T16DRAFT_322463 [Cercophora newfieldiana]|uniref:NACHT-NTPase and P-loop NTPases N-terminal domain-containing protein n=1 Tax=Cercophora newfieldiana TaxID=92897 RepID=A0AA39YIA2_9PEZI|nr:hypothetical protein B0T16DRAFT_322463 [Cercophora newfieldiana]
MAKIAKTIAQAFTKGRRSAPAEFREVENQLYSLSAALAAFQDTADKSSTELSNLATMQQGGDQTLSDMLSNCHETLKHLEKIVQKYGLITEQQDPTKSRLQRWSQELLKNYKKIAWTTEAGDLATLRSQLMVHTNSLDLVLGIVINSRTSRIEDTLKQNSERLSEIHAWWEQNLKNSTIQATETGMGFAARTATFEVHIETGNGLQLLCPESSLREDWKDADHSQLFNCECRGDERRGPEHWRVEKIGLSPISFPFRQIGDALAWTIYKAIDLSSNTLISLTIRNITAGEIAEFEELFIHALSELRATSMLKHGVSNMLAHPSPGGQKIRVLHLKGDLGNTHKFVDNVIFGIGHRTLIKSNICGLSLLHFREISAGDTLRGSSSVDYAEVLIHYDQPGGLSSNITRTEMRCAKELFNQLEAMRMELFVLTLQYCRPDETVALHLQVTQVQCEKVFIRDAEMMIMRNQEGKFRLVILSRNRCTVLSQELPETFFTDGNSSGRGPSNFRSLTWLVQLEGQGERKVYRYPNGFKFLNLHSVYAERMFELGRIAVSQPSSILADTEIEA